MIEITINQELMDLNNYILGLNKSRWNGLAFKKEQTSLVAAEVRKLVNKGIEFQKNDFPLDFEFHWYTKNKRKDKDNIVFAKKFIFDGMIEGGLIKNDGWKEIGSFTDVVSVDKDNPRVEIKIKTSS